MGNQSRYVIPLVQVQKRNLVNYSIYTIQIEFGVQTDFASLQHVKWPKLLDLFFFFFFWSEVFHKHIQGMWEIIHVQYTENYTIEMRNCTIHMKKNSNIAAKFDMP